MVPKRALCAGVGYVALFAAWGCSGGGGSTATTSFEVSHVSVQDGAVWAINREIVVGFSVAVDFSSVSSNTIHIRSLSGVPATGSFFLRDPRTVVFQPSCPTRDDLSDAGLQAGGATYVLRIPGLEASANTVRSITGRPLELGQVRTFHTPASTEATVVFQDPRPGPPLPVLRSQGSANPAATCMEIGGDPSARVYFELDASQALVLSEPGFEAPLNLYSDETTRVAVDIAFDQPVSPSASNVSENRLRLEFLDASGNWQPIRTRVTLADNCSGSGARVRLEPVGVLPAASPTYS